MESLREAALKGSVTSLLELLQKDPLILDRLIVDCVAETPLHIAAILGHVDFARELAIRKPELAWGYNLRGQSPLHLASAKGYVEIVNLLLSIGSDICLVRDRDGKIPLHLAAMKGQIEVLKELVGARPEAKQVLVDRGQTMLHLCVKHGRLEALKLLLDSVGDDEFVNLKDDYGNTVLHFAVAKKQYEAIEFLLSRTGVNVNSLNANGFTALDLKDTGIGEALDDAGTLRARDLTPAARETGSIRPIAANDTATAEPPSQGSKWEKQLKKHDEWLEKKRSTLMVVASLIATMTFQAGLNPPGGVWRDDSPPHVAGSPIMANNYPGEYTLFLGLNTTAFGASISIILLLISGLPLKRRFFTWIHMIIMWVAIVSTALTYIIAIITLVPYPANMTTVYIRITLTMVVLCLWVLLVLGHTIRLLVKLFRKLGRLCCVNNEANV